MNTKSTKEIVEQHNVVAMRADKAEMGEEFQQVLAALGNPKSAIPFYAVYGPGVTAPITFDGPISHKQVADAIIRAKGEPVESVAKKVDVNKPVGAIQ